jgi:hypothetical protein
MKTMEFTMQKLLSSTLALTALVLVSASSAQAAGLTTLTENFGSINTLPGSGWTVQNNSNPAALTPAGLNNQNWFQGSPTSVGFNAQAGATNSYIYTQFDATGADFGGTISNWLITPEFDFSVGGIFTFATRTVLGNPVPETLQVYQSNAGSSTNVGTTATSLGDFTTLLQTVGSLTSPTAYPGSSNLSNNWAVFTLNIGPVTGGTGSGRIGFRYFSPSGGASGDVGNLIGIDSVGYTAVPEPTSIAGTLLLGFASFGLRRKIRKPVA